MSEVDLTQLAVDRTRPPARRRHHLVSRYAIPIALLIGFSGLVAWSARDALYPRQPVTVVPVLATQARLQAEGTPLFQAAGWIEPRPTMVRVAAVAPGVVEKLLVVEDQAVVAGEPIAELIKVDAELAHQRALADRKLRQAELEASEATLRAAVTRFEQPVHLHASLGQADAALAKVKTDLANLPFELRRAKSQLEFAEKSYEGKQAAGGAISGRIVHAARIQVDTAKALVDELNSRKNSLEGEYAALVIRRDALAKQIDLLADETQARDEARAHVKASQARLELADVQVAEAKLQLDRMTVRAPIDGRIFQLIGHPGTRLTAGSRELATHDASTVVTMYCPDSLQVRVDVRFEDIPNISLGQQVTINNPALENSISGSVLFVGSEADIQKNTLEVKVAIPNPHLFFKPEMLVEVVFLAPATDDQTNASKQTTGLFLPRTLVRKQGEEDFVWLADQSAQIARKTVVELGVTGPGGIVEITNGLSVASRVIHGGSEGLHDGKRIQVTGEEKPVGAARPPFDVPASEMQKN